MDVFPHILDGFIHTLWDQNIIHTILYIFIHYLVSIIKQDSYGHLILDQNINSLQRVAQDLFNRGGCTTDHYSAVFDEWYTVHFGGMWLIHKRVWQTQIIVGVFWRHTRQRKDGQTNLCQVFGVS